METRKSFSLRRACLSGLILAALTGCAHNSATIITTQSETEIAVAAIKAEWLKACEGLSEEKDNSVGSLLQEYTELAGLLAVCMQRHNDFVSYIAPVVVKLKAK